MSYCFIPKTAEGNISHKFEMPSLKPLPNLWGEVAFPTFPLISFGINVHQRRVTATAI